MLSEYLTRFLDFVVDFAVLFLNFASCAYNPVLCKHEILKEERRQGKMKNKQSFARSEIHIGKFILDKYYLKVMTET